MSPSLKQPQCPQDVKDNCIVGLSKGWNKKKTAKEMGIHENSITNNLKKLKTSWGELKGTTIFPENTNNKQKKQNSKKTTKKSSVATSSTPTDTEIEEKKKELESKLEEEKKIQQSIRDLIDNFPKNTRTLVKPVLEGYFREKDLKRQADIMDKLMKYFKDDLDQDVNKKTGTNAKFYDLPYIRPNHILADIQRLALHLIHHKKFGFIEGARRTRKTITTIRGFYEESREVIKEPGEIIKIAYISAQGKIAESIHQNMIADKWNKDFCEPNKYVIDHTATKTKWHNGLTLEVRNTVTSDIKGGDFYFIIIDEADQILANPSKARAVADLIATALTHDHMKIIFLANRPEGKEIASFRAFTRAFKKTDFWIKIMGLKEEQALSILEDMFHLTMEQSDYPEMQTEEFSKKRDMVKGMQTLLVDKGYADSQMDNKDPTTGMLFPLSRIEDAVNNYNNFMKTMENKEPFITVMGVDTSGGVHPTGISIWSGYHKNIYERYSQKIEGQQNLDDDYIRNTILDLIDLYNVDVVVIESNNGGKRTKYWLEQRLDKNVTKVYNQNFEGDKTMKGHSDYISVVRSYMQRQTLFILTNLVETQWGKYNPYISSSTKRKGDVADAALHAVFRLNIELQKAYRKGERQLSGVVG